jgi:hypothetical protein
MPTSLRKTRVRGFCAGPSGRYSSRHGKPRRIATGCGVCGYKTASGRGKWPNRDPIGEKGFEHLRRQGWGHTDANRYLFARNNPLKFFDPLGLQEAEPEPGDPVNPPTRGPGGVGYNCLRLGDNCGWFDPPENPDVPVGPYNPNAPITPSPVCIMYPGPPSPPPPRTPPPPAWPPCSTCDINNPPPITISGPPPPYHLARL